MDPVEAGSSGVKIFTRLQLWNMMQQQNLPTISEKLGYIENYLLNYDNYNGDETKEIKLAFSYVKSEFKRRWIAASRRTDLFAKNNHDWLQGIFTLPRTAKRSGRPSIQFEDLSDRSKRRKTEDFRKNMEVEVLTYATQMKLHEKGKRDASKVLKDLTSSPSRAKKYKKAYSSITQEKKNQLTPLNALSMMVEASLSRRQYEIIRSTNKSFYPCYSLLQREKMKIYPDKSSCVVTETCAEIKLQNLMDHTVRRLLLYLKEVVQMLSQEESNTLHLICKWGCDGSQQKQFKQKFLNDEDSDANTSIFQSSFVPLQLICDFNKKVIWQNPTPSSPRYCRPIRIRFVKESIDITNAEITYVQNSANLLKETKEILFDKHFSVKHTMMLTMIDGKVCNAATQTGSTMRCYICGATSKDFNNLTLTREINGDTLKLGLSILHARIRIFESLLHLSYKLPIKKWRVQSESEKEIIKERKLQIQSDFREKLGLIVDVPKPGFGSTNDGNTSRRFFNDPAIASEILGVDQELIYRFKIILETISSGHKINTKKFSEYAMETAKLYVKLYPWHPMTPTVHKILIHGAIVIENVLLPIGQLSEEASEARNKHFRQYRDNFARKFSRTACNLDVLNRLLLSSDPLLSGIRPLPKKKSLPFSKETLEMLLPAEPLSVSSSVAPDESSEDDDDDDDDGSEIVSDEESWHSSPTD